VNNHGRVIELWLHGPEVDAKAMDAVSELKELRNISLWGAHLTDESLVKLKPLKWLETLGMAGVPISDRGLEHLAYLKRLRMLWITKTEKISEEQVDNLKRALPNLRVDWQ